VYVALDRPPLGAAERERKREARCWSTWGTRYNDAEYYGRSGVRVLAAIRTDSSHVLEQSLRVTIITTALRRLAPSLFLPALLTRERVLARQSDEQRTVRAPLASGRSRSSVKIRSSTFIECPLPRAHPHRRVPFRRTESCGFPSQTAVTIATRDRPHRE